MNTTEDKIIDLKVVKEGNKQVAKEELNLLDLAKKHGWKVGVGALIVVGGVVIGKKIIKGSTKIPRNDMILEVLPNLYKSKEIEKPNTEFGELIRDLWKEGDGVNVIMKDGININDVGKFTTDLADYLKDKDPEFNFDMCEIGIMGFYKKEV